MHRLIAAAASICVPFSAIVATVMLAGSASYAAQTAGAQEGCLNQWLFNGVWRVRVTGFEPYMNGTTQTGWQVTEVWRNGVSQSQSPADSSLENQVLELGNGSTIAAKDSTTGSLSMGSLGFNTFAQAGQFTYKQIFIGSTPPDPSVKPKGVTITFNGDVLAQEKRNTKKAQFTTSQYNFHFKLDCTAGGAAAQAQGGSTQIAGSDGCMNQWMANGIWKVRVTSITPRHMSREDPSTMQTGWTVTQDWQNATTHRLYPGVLPDMANSGGPVYQSNVADEYLVTQSGNNASSANTAGDMGVLDNHLFPPGATWTYQQDFSWNPFDPNDKPIRLLVTFDAKTQNALVGKPHYKLPPNFRIDLTCSK